MRSMSQQHRLILVSQQLAKLVVGESQIPYDVTHRYGIDWIMTGNRNESVFVVSHQYLFALSNDSASQLLAGSNRVEMIDAWQFGHN